jgi:opacity protein-like surface antigen
LAGVAPRPTRVGQMVKAFKLLLATASVVAVFGTPVMAADLDEPIFVEQAPDEVPVEIGNGWYIRGDVGVNLNGTYSKQTYSNGLVDYVDDFNDVTIAGGGIGYQINDMFRVDATFDRLAGSFSSRTEPIAPRGPCNGWGTYINTTTNVSYIGNMDMLNCMDYDSASYSANTLIANAYVDLGTFVGFTPYVGAGIGMAQVNWNTETDTTICTPQNAAVNVQGCGAYGSPNQPAPNTPYTEIGTLDSGTDYLLAYSVTAGIGYKATRNLTWDFSYKYLVIGTNEAFNVDVHQAKVGLRYALW